MKQTKPPHIPPQARADCKGVVREHRSFSSQSTACEKQDLPAAPGSQPASALKGGTRAVTEHSHAADSQLPGAGQHWDEAAQNGRCRVTVGQGAEGSLPLAQDTCSGTQGQNCLDLTTVTFPL